MRKINYFFALDAFAVAACGQTVEEKVKAFEETHEAMMTEYSQPMDSLANDQVKAEEYYNQFVEKYIAFNLESAKKNADNEVAGQALLNLRGLIEDDQVEEVI